MRRILTVIGATLAAAWALFVFVASNSPADVERRAKGWLSLPLIRDLPDAAIAFARSPVVLAVTFFGLGLYIGWKLGSQRKRSKPDAWWKPLGTELSLLAYDVKDAGPFTDMHRLSARINLMAVKLEKRGFPFPYQDKGFTTVDMLLPYMSQVSTYLKAGEVEHARAAAAALAQSPPAKGY